MQSRSPYAHIDRLLRWYFREMPLRVQAVVDDLADTRRQLQQLDDDMIPNCTPTYDESVHGQGVTTDSTSMAALRLEQRAATLHRWELQLLMEQAEYATVGRNVLAALRLVRDDVLALIHKRYSGQDIVPYAQLAENCDESTRRYHLNEAYRQIHMFMAPRLRMSAETLPFLRQYCPDVLPQISPRIRPKRIESVVLL